MRLVDRRAELELVPHPRWIVRGRAILQGVLVHALETVDEIFEARAKRGDLGRFAGRAAVEGGNGLVDPCAVVPSVVLRDKGLSHLRIEPPLGGLPLRIAWVLAAEDLRGDARHDLSPEVLMRGRAVSERAACEPLEECSAARTSLHGVCLQREGLALELHGSQARERARRVVSYPCPRAVFALRDAFGLGAVESSHESGDIVDVERHPRHHHGLAVGVPELGNGGLEDRAHPCVVEEGRKLLVEVVERARRIVAEKLLTVLLQRGEH